MRIGYHANETLSGSHRLGIPLTAADGDTGYYAGRTGAKGEAPFWRKHIG